MMFLILCLPGCLVGPDYQQPDLNVPEDEWWRTFANNELRSG